MTESTPSEKQIINKSTIIVIGSLMVAIALFGWVCLANAYSYSFEPWLYPEPDAVDEMGRSNEDGSVTQIKKKSVPLSQILLNSVRLIPQVRSVLTFNYQFRPYLVILFVCLESMILLLGYIMVKNEPTRK